MNPRKTLLSAYLGLLLVSTAALAQQKPIAIVGARLLTVSHGTIPDGTLLIQNGKILAADARSAVTIPAGATVIDARGKTLYPGLIDPDTSLGLMEVGSDRNTTDTSERSDEIMPHMHVADAFHAETELIPVARINGVTNAVIAPGDDDSIAGQDAFIQLAGKDRDAMILRSDIALAINYGGNQKRPEPTFPSTRMGLISQLRQSLLDAQQYDATLQASKKKSETKDPGKPAEIPPARDLKLEALLPYLHGDRPLVVQVTESYDAETIMQVAREFHLRVVLKGMTHTQDILDEVAQWKVPVIFGSIYTQPLPNERYDAVYSMPAQLARRGVKVAIMSTDAGGPGGAHSVRNLPYAAGFAASYGLPYDEALKAITLNVAEIFGFADRLGSLDPGKDANFVIANGDPLDVRTNVEQVYIQGKSIPLESRQTRLRDEYSK